MRCMLKVSGFSDQTLSDNLFLLLDGHRGILVVSSSVSLCDAWSFLLSKKIVGFRRVRFDENWGISTTRTFAAKVCYRLEESGLGFG